MSSQGDSRRAANPGRNRVDLPPIRTVLGDQLALPRPPSTYPLHTASSRSPTHAERWEAHAISDAHQQTVLRHHAESRESPARQPNESRSTALSYSFSSSGPQAEPSPPLSLSSTQSLPPIPFYPINRPTRNYSDPQSPIIPDIETSRLTWRHPILPNSAPPFSSQLPYYFGVLRTSTATGELITSPPIMRLPNRPRTASSGSRTAREDAVAVRRHVCPVCHKRFPRPSSLITHQSVHNGSRPFSCIYPGCSKKFSVASNMRRHFRKCHSNAGNSTAASPSPASDGDGDAEMESEEEPVSSSSQMISTSPTLRHSATEESPVDNDV